MDLSFIKILCTLVVATALHIAQTPPSGAAPKTSKIVGKNLGNRILLSIQRNLFLWVKGPIWFLALLEVAVIVSRHVPNPLPFEMVLEKGAEADLSISPQAIVGMFSLIIGTLIRISCYRTMKKFFTFEVTIHRDHKLITNGPYSVVRHPSYLGTIFVYTGMFCWYSSPGSLLRESKVPYTLVGQIFLILESIFFVGIAFGVLRRIPEEDQLMKKTFGKEWEEWARKVPYRLIPGVW